MEIQTAYAIDHAQVCITSDHLQVVPVVLEHRGENGKTHAADRKLSLSTCGAARMCGALFRRNMVERGRVPPSWHLPPLSCSHLGVVGQQLLQLDYGLPAVLGEQPLAHALQQRLHLALVVVLG